MKRAFLIIVLFMLPASLYSQWGIVPSDVDVALRRIEQAFQSGSPSNISDMFQTAITMRLEDSLYQDVSSIQAVDLLKDYFANKSDIKFNFLTPGSGRMIYTSNGKTDTMNVDIWLRRHITGPSIYAINISNYPLATVFFDIPRNKK